MNQNQFSWSRWMLCGVVAWVSSTSLAQVTSGPAKPKPRIVKFPNTPVWSDPTLAAKELPISVFVGEFEKGDEALQATLAGGRFYLSIYQGGLPGAGWRGDTVKHEWVATSAIEERLSDWKKLDRSRDVVGKQPPEGAIVLFDGTNTEFWKNGKIENGYLKAGTASKAKYRDFTLYLEWLLPLKPEPPIGHPHRANSGVFALGAYEVQIADTFALDPSPQAWTDAELLKPVNTWCGSVYGIRAADFNMCLPPLVWQSIEIDFTAAKFKAGKKTSPAVISVIQNGVKIHDNVELPEGTGGGPSGPRPEVAEGPITLQNHGNPNLFRNIWIVPR